MDLIGANWYGSDVNNSIEVLVLGFVVLGTL
eukprot:COSAG02_NODE_24468_length_687_cov_1.011905_1_plen_30_part_10